jgi:hypothetical protein
MPTPGWLLDSPAEFFIRHGGDIFLVLRNSLAQQIELRTMGVKICPQGNADHPCPIFLVGCRHQIVYKGGLFSLVPAKGEQLLKLIDD